MVEATTGLPQLGRTDVRSSYRIVGTVCPHESDVIHMADHKDTKGDRAKDSDVRTTKSKDTLED